jgi:single-strand DNA-binding protein
MSTSLNKVILIGRLGKDPEIRFTSGGKAVANMTIATDESWKDRDGNKQSKVEWHSLVLWGASVQAFVEPYLHKGDLIYVEGKIQTRQWEKDGVKRYTTEISVTDIKGLSTGDRNGHSTSQQMAQPAPAEPEPVTVPDDSDEIPF